MPSNGGVILVVEDEDVVRGVIVRLLENAGYTVLQAENGERALAVMQEHHEPVHLVVTDIEMPEMDGLELVSFLRSAYPSLRALLVSGQSAEFLVENRHRIDDETHFLGKPFKPRELTDRVRAILGQDPATTD
jgi:two-component system, cell cycle sensor histidine kinase and response regulator CckA